MDYKIEELVEEYSNMIMQIAYQNNFNKTDAEDITQEVFIKLDKGTEFLSSEKSTLKILKIIKLDFAIICIKNIYYCTFFYTLVITSFTFFLLNSIIIKSNFMIKGVIEIWILMI